MFLFVSTSFWLKPLPTEAHFQQGEASSDGQDPSVNRLAQVIINLNLFLKLLDHSVAYSKVDIRDLCAVDLSSMDASEEDKIKAMMTQSTQDYDPSNYIKIKGANQVGEVPSNYRCYKCHQTGHWIKNCPLIQEPIEIKKSTGIPRSFMVPVEGPLVPGAMMTPTGHFAVPAIDHEAYKEQKKEKPPFQQDAPSIEEKPEIPEDLVCSVCKDLLSDAVMIPCCGIRTVLLDSEDHECPDCREKGVSPDTLIPNRFLRNSVNNFKNATGYRKIEPAPRHQSKEVPPPPVSKSKGLSASMAPVTQTDEQVPGTQILQAQKSSSSVLPSDPSSVTTMPDSGETESTATEVITSVSSSIIPVVGASVAQVAPMTGSYSSGVSSRGQLPTYPSSNREYPSSQPSVSAPNVSTTRVVPTHPASQHHLQQPIPATVSVPSVPHQTTLQTVPQHPSNLTTVIPGHSYQQRRQIEERPGTPTVDERNLDAVIPISTLPDTSIPPPNYVSEDTTVVTAVSTVTSASVVPYNATDHQPQQEGYQIETIGSARVRPRGMMPGPSPPYAPPRGPNEVPQDHHFGPPPH
ncbi:hypothetical protein J437_LFUL005465, partial [Ladona fulva]